MFRASGSTGNTSIVRVEEADSNNPTGAVRYYNEYGQPTNAMGLPGPNDETHLPLRGGEPGSGEDPIGDIFELCYATSC